MCIHRFPVNQYPTFGVQSVRPAAVLTTRTSCSGKVAWTRVRRGEILPISPRYQELLLSQPVNYCSLRSYVYLKSYYYLRVIQELFKS